ncbi:O-antigen ligase family protein [Algoriphagus halophytocola]|uniref:O-antigen ligase family protein n=1 Tax=Algoriphagus halophytocola TaxID=2991499 RepID=A0ABY6MDZ4_9BACT|nr:O-antigen ligase family protein [Algoriphagus sp. TR-M5]UZD21373.1 O-antigen ligase family protein [Algoriphagus sp. TR-M5]
MAIIFFLLIAAAVGAGFLWVVQKMVFQGKWSYFIYFLAAFLPFYITSLSLAYLTTRSTVVVSLFQVSKEFIVLIAGLSFLAYQKRLFNYPFRLQSTDWFMFSFLGLAVLFLFLPIGQASFVNKALYFKSMLIPSLVYFLGRNTNFSGFELRKLFQLIFVVAIAAFLVNLVERFLLGAHLQQFTGYALFNQVVNNIEPEGNYGLTWTFETTNAMKRLGSFFSDPLELASSVLMGFSAGLIWFLTTEREQQWKYLLVMLCSTGSLVFASSRASFAAFFLMIFFIALVFRLYKLIGIGLLSLVTFAGFILFFASDDLYFYVIDTLTLADTSSVGHVVEWALALESMLSNPLGIGLAMSGNFGSVSDELRVGGENQFLIYGVQLGWVGMLLYIGTLFSGIRNAIFVFKNSENLNIARMAFVAGTVKAGLLLPLFTANVEIYTYVSWVSWWMVGISINEYSRLRLHSQQTELQNK